MHWWTTRQLLDVLNLKRVENWRSEKRITWKKKRRKRRRKTNRVVLCLVTVI